MFEVFSFSFNAVAPILLLAVTGYIIKQAGLFDDGFFKKCNTLVFKVFLPILIFKNIYDIDSVGDINFAVMLYCVVAIVVLCVIGNLVAGIFAQNRGQKGVINQSSFRSNYAIIGIPLAESLGGAPAVAFAGVLSAVCIPIFNFMAVIILSRYSKSDYEPPVKDIIKSVGKNPLIRAVALGIAVLLVRSLIPTNEAGELLFSVKDDLSFIYATISNLSKVASPLALVVLGARFEFKSVRSLAKPIIVSTILRLVVAPLIGIGSAVILNYMGIISFTTTEYPALISLFGTPIAVSSAVMVGEIGGDEQLAGQIVVWTSLVSVFSIFAIVFLMRSMALI